MESTLRIMVLGADGYIGWPLTLELMSRHQGASFYLLDNGLRRRNVASLGGASLTNIVPMSQRVRVAAKELGVERAHFSEMDITNPDFLSVLADFRPDVIYHLAQQGSAPLSMKDCASALETVRNNEVGNLQLLWGIREHCPNAHLVKLGSFGEYAQCGLDIPEGYFQPTFRGKQATVPAPFPRESDDVYHITKINDSNFISMGCRQWGLRISDIMQATIVGCSLTQAVSKQLPTRFDYDPCFGTVLNRFIVQAVAGMPISVYGTGHQRSGLCGLNDAVRSLANQIDEAPAAGVHRVVNHVAETNLSVNEIANLCVEVAASLGISAIIERTHNPRQENHAEKLNFGIDTKAFQAQPASPIMDVMRDVFHFATLNKDSIRAELLAPGFEW